MKEARNNGVGLGLRPVHYNDWIHGTHPIPWCEIISENYMYTKGAPLKKLLKIRQEIPVAIHGISMSIGSNRNNFSTYLDSLEKLIQCIEPWIVTDHFCWTGLGGHNSFDLLPLPFTHDSMARLIEAIDRVQNQLNRKVYFENISSYIGYKESNFQEVDFINEVLKKSGCGMLLDINNLYVNSHNFSFNPYEYIDKLQKENIGEIHLAGHSQVNDFLFDTHDTKISDNVWKLYQYTLNIHGKIPTLIEWDESIPPFETLLEESSIANAIMNGEKLLIP